jgi:tRNA threonylcarbamoyladenosine biosynthesis protein TsaB
VGGVALGHENDVLGILEFGKASSHLVELGRCVDRLLGDHGLTIDRVERIALVEGPGSFTGLRVGLAFIKGLYAGLGVDVVTIGTLELLALPHLGGWAYVCPMIDARKREVYAAVYKGGETDGNVNPHFAETVLEPRVQAPKACLDEAEKFSPLFVGSGALRYRKLIADVWGEDSIAFGQAASPSVDYLCRIASRLKPLSDSEVRSLEPLYIRASEAELKRLKPIDPHA